MSNAYVRLRMSKTDHPMPRRKNEQIDLSGLRGSADYKEVGNTGLDNGQQLEAPQKYRAFDTTNDKYGYTPIAKPAEIVDGGNEGGRKGKTKSHRTSKNRN